MFSEGRGLGFAFHEREEQDGDGQNRRQDGPEEDVFALGLGEEAADEASDDHDDDNHGRPAIASSGRCSARLCPTRACRWEGSR